MDFLKYKNLYFLISGSLIVTSIISLSMWKLQLAIDFTGGSLIELQFEQTPDITQIREILNPSTIQSNNAITPPAIQTAQNNKIIIKTEPITQEQVNEIQRILHQQLNQQTTLNRFESIGPVLGQELLTKMLIAVAITALFILSYIAWTFKNWQYGIAAIIAMFHDTLILIGSFSVLGHFLSIEIDALFITAILTTLSFSVHDTVVVFDRIRESGKQYQIIHPAHNGKIETGNSKNLTFAQLSNKAITETMSRSLNNSLTIMFMLAALLLLGGTALKWFVTALLIGTITGTYSSPFVAVPILNILKTKSLFHFLRRKSSR
jgi:preprotein translocase subunit SecF